LQIGFYGVRGSTPCACEVNRRYGGNTACVVLQHPGCDPVILDIGTGLRHFGEQWEAQDNPAFVGHALVTHLHWDHVQGLPFFGPLLGEGSRLEVWGPAIDGVDLRTAFDEFMRPPYFPVGIDDLPANADTRVRTTRASVPTKKKPNAPPISPTTSAGKRVMPVRGPITPIMTNSMIKKPALIAMPNPTGPIRSTNALRYLTID
jgi:phosphoribosyl 1,2-cyclic phosphodiesterase